MEAKFQTIGRRDHLNLGVVRLPELPLEFFNEELLMRVGDHLGTAIKVDGTTVAAMRGRFARIYLNRTQETSDFDGA